MEPITSRLPPLTHVAIRFQDKIFSLPRPYRHHHIMRAILFLVEEFGQYTSLTSDTKEVLDGGIDSHGDDQGFLDASGKYLTRNAAYANAVANDQIKNGEMIGSVLTSEDLW